MTLGKLDQHFRRPAQQAPRAQVCIKHDATSNCFSPPSRGREARWTNCGKFGFGCGGQHFPFAGATLVQSFDVLSLCGLRHVSQSCRLGVRCFDQKQNGAHPTLNTEVREPIPASSDRPFQLVIGRAQICDQTHGGSSIGGHSNYPGGSPARLCVLAGRRSYENVRAHQ